MRKTMRWISIALAAALTLGLLGLVPTASAQRRHVVIVERGPFWGPYWGWGPYYPYGYYAYPPRNSGEVKIDTHMKDAGLYIDGGYAGKIQDNKKFWLKPGNHDIELRDHDGQTLYQEQVAVTIGHTTKLHVS
jgi:hypothetical protein